MAPLEGSAEDAETGPVRLRVSEENGFGLIELVMAMFMLNVGILALVAAFNSGAIALRRASHISTGAAIADSQMELYRALTYAQIGFDATTIAGLDNTYKCDVALDPANGVHACPNTITTCALPAVCADYTVPTRTSCSTLAECQPYRSVTASTTPASPDHYAYRVDSYIVFKTPTNGRQLKEITVVVRDAANPARTYARQTSTFDPSTSG
jgi:Tfp pilus assembly protein PilE